MNRYTYNTNYKKYKRVQNILNLKKIIFPPISDNKINQLLIDNESIKYITFNTSAQQITNIILENLTDFPCPDNKEEVSWDFMSIYDKMKHLIITEMTAGVGGNVLNFAKYFKYVNAIEINKTRYDYLQNNIKLYNYDNVNCYNDNSLDLLINHNDLVQDIIFFDPPWGGKDYKLHNNLRLNFGSDSIENICQELLSKSKANMIVMKLPCNYDFEFMFTLLSTRNIIKYSLDKMSIVIVKNFNNNNTNNIKIINQ
uniref:Putative RNA methylase n=1 Tax=Borely moumouvirus TaxID=2712067 RepID=A0A6G6ACS8_9VIRU